MFKYFRYNKADCDTPIVAAWTLSFGNRYGDTAPKGCSWNINESEHFDCVLNRFLQASMAPDVTLSWQIAQQDDSIGPWVPIDLLLKSEMLNNVQH